MFIARTRLLIDHIERAMHYVVSLAFMPYIMWLLTFITMTRRFIFFMYTVHTSSFTYNNLLVLLYVECVKIELNGGQFVGGRIKGGDQQVI
jgi:hypothetical protein